MRHASAGMHGVRHLVMLPVLCAHALGAELVPFTLPWDDGAPGPTDLSATIDKPAGRSGFVRVTDAHLRVAERRLKLFGVNVTAGACFPDHETADKIAARMAKFGLNAVRFHFLDSTWGEPRLVRYDTGDWTNWDADALDRLDYFISRLKANGLYANLNLLVGRRFGEGDGVDPQINQLDWKSAHAVGFFSAKHMDAQKAYARRLLTHRNPYTKLRYVDDPAVAMVEISNENGLLHTWMGGGFDSLPDTFARELQKQWNGWLGARYVDTTALSAAWDMRNEPLGKELLANTDFTQGLRGWHVEQHGGAVVDCSVTNRMAILRIRETGDAGWHVQFNQPGLAVRKGGIYTVSFRAAADRERMVRLSLMMAHAPWEELGFRATLRLEKEPTSFTFTFFAADDDDNARLNFGDMNQEGAEFQFGELSMRSGGRTGPVEGQSLEERNIRIPRAADARIQSGGERLDWIRFLWETERRHWTDMQRFLKEELGVKVPVVGTAVQTATPNLMADLDLVDTHAYWEHPRFPDRPWDRDNWSVGNLSMVDYPERATVTRLAFQRVAGKPHMVSEYNHPAPNTHAGEAPLFVAAFGALQDWDAIFLYTYSHDDTRTKAGRIPDFFDVGQHPTIMANVPVASLLFRRGDIAAATQLVRVPLAPEEEIRRIAQHGQAWDVFGVGQLGVPLGNAIRHRIALDVTGKTAPPDLTAPAWDAVTSDTGEIAWRLPAPDQGVLELRTPRTKGVLGHVDGHTIDLGDGVQVTVEKTRTGWSTLVLTLLEGESLAQQPRRALLVATAYTENTDMGWRDDTRNTVGTNWGRSPSLVETVAATLRLPRTAVLPTLYALDERGQRGPGIAFTPAGEQAVQVRIGPPQKTLWYEVSWLPR